MYEELPDLDLNAKADVSMPRGQVNMYQPVLVSGIRGKGGGEKSTIIIGYVTDNSDVCQSNCIHEMGQTYLIFSLSTHSIEA